MSQIKKITRVLLFIYLTSCRMFRSDEQNAMHDVDKYQRKLNRIYAEYPKFKRDTIKGEVVIEVPIRVVDTVVQYKDSITRKIIYKRIVEKCKDSTLAKEIIKKLDGYKCIKDSIVVKDTLFKAIITQDSLGIHINIIPRDTVLKAKYAVACPPLICKDDEFWQHSEFWFLTGLFLITVLGILIHLRLQR
jgi:hypothetical protein